MQPQKEEEDGVDTTEICSSLNDLTCTDDNSELDTSKKSQSTHDLMKTEDTSVGDLSFWKERAAASRLTDTQLAIGGAHSPGNWVDSYKPAVYHSGWLIKRGHHFRNFKRRLFCIIGKELVYHDHHQANDRKGSLNLGLETCVYTIRNNGFKIVQGTYELLLYAIDEKDRSTWLQKLSACGAQLPSSPCISSTITENVIPPSEIIFSGWLRKRGQVVKSCRRRWFVLQDRQLKYYVSPEVLAERGSIDLVDACIQYIDTAKTGERYSFTIISPSRSTVVFADSNEDRALWVTNLRVAANTTDTNYNPILHSPYYETSLVTDDEVMRDIRHEIQLILASPYSPEGNTGMQFLKENSSNPNLELYEIQKFMHGLTFYMKETRMHELELLAGGIQDDSASAKILKIIGEEVEEAIFHPLYKIVYQRIHSKLKGASKSLAERMELLKEKPQSFFGIPPMKHSPSNWKAVSLLLGRIDESTLPHAKRTGLVKGANQIYLTFCDEHPNEGLMGADDFIPAFIFSLVHSDLEDPLCLKELLLALNPTDESGEASYFLTCLEVALEYIRSLVIACTVVLDTHQQLGIGFEVDQRGKGAVVREVIHNGQASNTGVIHVGDILIAVNGTPVHEEKLTVIANMIKNSQSTVELSFLPHDAHNTNTTIST